MDQIAHPRSARQADARPSLIWIGVRQGALIGLGTALIYGYSILALITLLTRPREISTLGVVFYLLATTVGAGIPGLVLGSLLGGGIGAGLRRWPADGFSWDAAGLGITVTLAGVVLLHGIVFMLGGRMWNPLRLSYWLVLGLPSGLMLSAGAITAVRLYRRLRA